MDDAYKQLMDEQTERNRLLSIYTHEEEEEESPEISQRLTFDEFIQSNSDPKVIKAFTRFSKDEFMIVMNMIEGVLGHQGGRGKRSKILPIDKFFYTIVYLVSGWTFYHLSRVFRIPRSTLLKIVHETIDKIHDSLISEYIPENFHQNFNPRFRNFPNAVGACDVSLIRIQKPKGYDTQKLYYEGKNKAHGIKLQVLFGPDGICYHFDISKKRKQP